MDWKKRATGAVKEQKVLPIDGPITALFELGPPDRRVFDLDNRIKAVLDIIVKEKIIQDDNHKFLKEYTVKLSHEFVGVRVTLWGFQGE